MSHTIRFARIKRMIGPVVRPVCAVCPTLLSLDLMRRCFRIQLAPAHMQRVSSVVRKVRPCRLLIFGVGRDSSFWYALNRGGTTVFLEDDEGWLQEVHRLYPRLDIRKVTYGMKLKEWKEVIESRERLVMSLPGDLSEGSWDAILVDAPRGHNENTPGRMQSIFMASELVGPHGHVFVHDCQRMVEGLCCDSFLNDMHLVAELPDPGGTFRHYCKEG